MIVTTFGFVGGPISPCFVRIELRIERGMLFRLSGVSSTAAKSAKARIRSALLSCGYRWPGKAITVNIAPADLSRTSTAYDLPIALCILAAEGHICKKRLREIAASGEIGLDGTLIPSSTINNIAQNLNSQIINTSKIKELIHSTVNYSMIQKQRISQIVKHKSSTYSHLKEVITYIRISKNISKKEVKANTTTEEHTQKATDYSFANIKGEPTAKRKAIIAAAGNHHIILMGPPGSGKSILARCIHALIPKTEIENGPPWQAPHSSTGVAGLIGAWHKTRDVGVIPGAWSLAHQGVLFLDEWPEFSRAALESCRVPMETGRVALSRAAGSVELPSKALLIAALNPCPCGQLTKTNGICFCTPGEVRKYLKKVSGPVADRFVIHVELGNEVKLSENSNYQEYHKTQNNSVNSKNTEKTQKKILLQDNSEFYDEKDAKIAIGAKVKVGEIKQKNLLSFENLEKSALLTENHQKEEFFNENMREMIINEDLCKTDRCEAGKEVREILQNTEKDGKHIKKEVLGINTCVLDDKKVFYAGNGEFWKWAVRRVAHVRELKSRGVELTMSEEAREWLEGFQAIAYLSERGIKNIVDVANTAALIDESTSIEKEHIVEGAESRLFDRNSWLQSINDDSIPKYSKDLKPKLAACKINVL